MAQKGSNIIYTEQTYERISYLASKGITNEGIAADLNMRPETFSRHQRDRNLKFHYCYEDEETGEVVNKISQSLARGRGIGQLEAIPTWDKFIASGNWPAFKHRLAILGIREPKEDKVIQVSSTPFSTLPTEDIINLLPEL